MKYTITLLLSNLLLTPSLVECWGYDQRYLSRGRLGYLGRRDYEVLDKRQNPAHQALKDPRVSVIRRRDLNNQEENKLSVLVTDANNMKDNTKAAISRSGPSSGESFQLSEANSDSVEEFEATRSELGDNFIAMDANGDIVNNKSNHINNITDENLSGENSSQSKVESSAHSLANSENSSSDVNKSSISKVQPASINLDTSEDGTPTSTIDNSSLDNNNNNGTDSLLIKHRKDGYLELSNNQNNSNSNSFDSETNKLSNNSDGNGPNISRVQPLPIDLESAEDKKLALKSTDSTMIDNSSTGSVNTSTKNKVRIVDRAEVNNTNNSTGGETNNIDEDLSDIKFQNEFKNFESLRDGYWSVV